MPDPLHQKRRRTADWLKNRPSIEVVSRDRAGTYAEATRQGAPQAQQVADRWHLLQNLTEAVQRVVESHYSRLREIVQESRESSPEQTEEAEQIRNVSPPHSSAEQLQRAREERKQARCAEVLRLHAQGLPILSISRQLRIHRRLVSTCQV